MNRSRTPGGTCPGSDSGLGRLEQSGATLFRINLSHASLSELPQMIETIQQATDVPVSLDTEGAQIRTGDFVDGEITLRDNTIVRVELYRVDRSANGYNPGMSSLRGAATRESSNRSIPFQ